MTQVAQWAESRFLGMDAQGSDADMRPLFSVSLRNLLPQASFVGCGDLRVSDANCTSSRIPAGGLFAALPGTTRHGREFVTDAIDRGATAILTDLPLVHCELPQCIVANPRAAYSQLCHALYGNPTRHLSVVGVTGTNGKTTTTWMVRSILEAARGPCGLLGTIECSDGIGRAPSAMTTPESRSLAQFMAAMHSHRVRYATLEMSSHALDQERTCGTQLDVAVITNLTRDHFDYHQTFENYKAAKARIKSHLKRGGTLVLNADDPQVLSLREQGTSQVLTYGLTAEADVRAELLDITAQGTHFRVTAGAESVLFFTPLVGLYNVSNALAAIASTRQLGLSLKESVPGVERMAIVPGRMQRVDCGQEFPVWVDYAHTEDGLQRALEAVRPLIRGRLILVFGAGGDRDPGKRPRMGQAASMADLAIITNDNPRSESPQAIADAILQGWRGSHAPEVVLDRAAAIQRAVSLAEPGDGVLIAGKGHEQVQIEGADCRPFCDVATAQDAIQTVLSEALRWPAGPHARTSATDGIVSSNGFHEGSA